MLPIGSRSRREQLNVLTAWGLRTTLILDRLSPLRKCMSDRNRYVTNGITRRLKLEQLLNHTGQPQSDFKPSQMHKRGHWTCHHYVVTVN